VIGVLSCGRNQDHALASQVFAFAVHGHQRQNVDEDENSENDDLDECGGANVRWYLFEFIGVGVEVDAPRDEGDLVQNVYHKDEQPHRQQRLGIAEEADEKRDGSEEEENGEDERQHTTPGQVVLRPQEIVNVKNQQQCSQHKCVEGNQEAARLQPAQQTRLDNSGHFLVRQNEGVQSPE